MTFHMDQTLQKSSKYCRRNKAWNISPEVRFSRVFWCMFTNTGLSREGACLCRLVLIPQVGSTSISTRIRPHLACVADRLHRRLQRRLAALSVRMLPYACACRTSRNRAKSSHQENLIHERQPVSCPASKRVCIQIKWCFYHGLCLLIIVIVLINTYIAI